MSTGRPHVEVRRVLHWWVAEITPPSAGPIVLFTWESGRDRGLTRAVQCSRLRWNLRTGGIEVEGRLVRPSGDHLPYADRHGQLVHKILHLRKVIECRSPG